jgi:hypothetical protein
LLSERDKKNGRWWRIDYWAECSRNIFLEGKNLNLNRISEGEINMNKKSGQEGSEIPETWIIFDILYRLTAYYL